MIKKFILSCIALFVIAVGSFAQTADDLINKHIEAVGGKEKLNSIKTVKMLANMEVGPNMKAPITMYFVNNKSMRMEVEIQGMKMLQVVDGDSGWAVNPFSGKKEAERIDQDMIRQSKDQMDLTGNLFNYKEKGNAVEFMGKEDMEGTDTYKLKVTKKTGDIEYIYLDATNYLQLKTTSKFKFKDKDVESETLFSNYKKVAGMIFPFTIEERQPGAAQGQVINIETVEVNPKIDHAMFEMPATTPATSTPGETKK